MLFWIVVAILTAAAAAFILRPLMRGDRAPAGGASHDVAVYRDQLDELARDARAGMIPEGDAEIARAEIARRLLTASDAADREAEAEAAKGTLRGNVLAQVFVICCLPAIGLGFYLSEGSPDVPDLPLAARLADPSADMNILIVRAERHLEANPEDGTGWDVLAPIYRRVGRTDDAVTAYERAIRIVGATPERLAGLAESLIAASDGRVTEKAQDALRQLLSLVPGDPRGEFYLALALRQEGKAFQALTAFEALKVKSPADAPWLPMVMQEIAGLSQTAPKPPGEPSESDIAAATGMSSNDRQAMIRGMVDSLSGRLKDDPANFEGWMRLIRSYTVLGEKDKAAQALHDSLATFPAAGSEGKALLALAAELGLPAEGEGQVQ